jgi:hypothetical protein
MAVSRSRVHARHQYDEGDCRQQRPQERLELRSRDHRAARVQDRRIQRHDAHRPSGVGVWELACQISRNEVHLLLRLCHGHARLQPAVDDQGAELTIGDLGRRERDRNPDICRRTIPASRFKDTDDGIRDRIHANVTTDDVAIGAEALTPEPMGQDHHVLLARLILIGSEIPPKPHPFAQHAMPAGRDLSRDDELRRVAGREIQRPAGPEGLEILERLGSPFPLEILGR